jgi:hypothetical protein
VQCLDEGLSSVLTFLVSELRKVDVDVVTFGQYMRPTKRHMKVDRYVEPAEFDEWKGIAESMGFLYVASGPLVRSSYKARNTSNNANRSLPWYRLANSLSRTSCVVREKRRRPYHIEVRRHYFRSREWITLILKAHDLYLRVLDGSTHNLGINCAFICVACDLLLYYNTIVKLYAMSTGIPSLTSYGLRELRVRVRLEM